MRCVIMLLALLLIGCGHGPVGTPVLFHDDFTSLANWRVEAEAAGTVAVRDHALDIDVPAGCTVWFRPVLHGPVAIDYDATVVSAGGPNDRVSDLNCFWMARDARSPDELFATPRTGKFADYNPLLTYYASIGGNSNSTTRFRRYVGSATTRPIRPEHDRRDVEDMIVPNVVNRIHLVADGRRIEFWRDGRLVFKLHDENPYTSGWFAIRTTHSHLRIRHFRVTRPPPVTDEVPERDRVPQLVYAR